MRIDKMGKNRKLVLIAFTLLVYLACVEKFSLPEDLNTTGNTLVGDTTYLPIHPVWDASYGLMSPVDLSISKEGFVVIADSAAHSILVFDQSGLPQDGFEDLTQLTHNNGNFIAPIDVDTDTKMNIMYIDESDQIYRWNQYWNMVGIDSIVVEATFVEANSGQTISASYGTLLWLELVNSSSWTMSDMIWSANPVLLDSLLKPHTFYNDTSLINKSLDIHYGDEKSVFTAITTTDNDENHLFVTDLETNRVIEIVYAYNAYIRLGSGEKIWAHQGLFRRTVVIPGSGAGTASEPLGIDIDYENNIYYSQRGDVFSVHKIKPNNTGGNVSYTSAFQLDQDDIMDIGRFINPLDVAVDNSQMIYVSNTDQAEIQVFHSDGSFFKKAGVKNVYIDTSYYVQSGLIDTVIIDTTLLIDGNLVDTTLTLFEYDSVLVDTTFTREVKGMLIEPAGLTVDDRGVLYVCDPLTSSIFRFKLSNTLDEDIQPKQ